MSTDLPTPPPPYNPEAAPFWAAAAEGRLVLPRCTACEHHVWYPRSWCPVCGADEVTWVELSGRGRIYALTVLHRGMGPWREATPFAVAFVELDEGPRILANVLTDEPEALRVDDAVVAQFVPLPDLDADAPPQAILRFRPA